MESGDAEHIHLDPQNLQKVISLSGGDAWQTVLRTLVGLVHNRVLSQQPVHLPPEFYPHLSQDLAAMLYNAFQLERFVSTFAHFVFSCE